MYCPDDLEVSGSRPKRREDLFEKLVSCTLYLVFFLDHFIDQPILFCLFGAHIKIAVGVFFDYGE